MQTKNGKKNERRVRSKCYFGKRSLENFFRAKEIISLYL